jgi:hypothetical protein
MIDTNRYPARGFEGDRLQNHCVTTHLGNVVLEHLQPPHVVIGFGQQTHAILQINRAHALQPAPQRDPLRCRFRRHFIGQK